LMMGKSTTQRATNIASSFLMSALDGSERLASRRGRFTPREIPHGTCTIGGCVGPITALSVLEKRKISCSYMDRIPFQCRRSRILDTTLCQMRKRRKYIMILSFHVCSFSDGPDWVGRELIP
jgi:hypothetical protein